ncbi:MAG: hypothetical protein KGV59_05255 [Tenacibaculum sp.]|nr:hypothetical protein [Tenacibaculum sp.]
MRKNILVVIVLFFSVVTSLFAHSADFKYTRNNPFKNKVVELSLKDKINSPNAVGNFSYTVQNIKNVVCAGDGSVEIEVSADSGTNIGVFYYKARGWKRTKRKYCF